MEKILTIIIPTYNMEKYLDRCLTSMIIDDVELLKRLEVLVVIDGAKDRSSEIAHTYADKYPDTFVVIDKENGNYGSCVNRGLKEANGKYVKVVDADDWVMTKALQKILVFLSKHDYDLVLNDNYIVNEKGDVTDIFTILPHLKKGQSYSLHQLHGEPALSMKMHTIIYKTENIRALNYVQSEGVSYTDQEWMFIPMTNVKKIFYHEAILYMYLVGREGQTIAPDVLARTMKQYIGVYEKAFRTYAQWEGDDDAREYLKDRLASQAQLIYRRCLCEYENIDLKMLVQLDDIIRQCSPDVYRRMNKYHYLKIVFFIFWWRVLNRPTGKCFSGINHLLFKIRCRS